MISLGFGGEKAHDFTATAATVSRTPLTAAAGFDAHVDCGGFVAKGGFASGGALDVAGGRDRRCEQQGCEDGRSVLAHGRLLNQLCCLFLLSNFLRIRKTILGTGHFGDWPAIAPRANDAPGPLMGGGLPRNFWICWPTGRRLPRRGHGRLALTPEKRRTRDVLDSGMGKRLNAVDRRGAKRALGYGLLDVELDGAAAPGGPTRWWCPWQGGYPWRAEPRSPGATGAVMGGPCDCATPVIKGCLRRSRLIVVGGPVDCGVGEP